MDKNGTKEPDEVPTKAIATLAKMVTSTSYHIEVVDRYRSSSDNLHGWGKGTRAIRKKRCRLDRVTAHKSVELISNGADNIGQVNKKTWGSQFRDHD